ncbi:hypothetical protein NECAME_14833, partial [Necator americanus]
MHGLRVALLVVNGIISLTGIAANLILLVIIYVATPKPIRTYSVLIINYAVTDLFTSMAQAITIPRLLNGNNSLFLVFYGGCSQIGYSACLFSFAIEAFGFSHSLNSILLSICYRYFSLRYGVPERKPIIILCLVTSLPSLIPVFTLWQKWVNEPTIPPHISQFLGDIKGDNLVFA